MQKIALSIFQILLILEIAWLGLRMLLKNATFDEIVREFLQVLLVSGIMLSIITYYESWTASIVNGLSSSYDASFKDVSPEQLLLKDFTDYVHKTIDKFKISFDAIGQILCIVVMTNCLALLILFIVCILLESYLVLNIGVVLLGFGSLKLSRDFTVNYIKYVFGVALKLLSMKVLASILRSSLGDLTDPKEFSDYLYGACTIILITGLFKTVPGIVAGLVSHATVSSGAVGAVASAASGAFAGGALGASLGGKAASAAGSATSALADAVGKGAQAVGSRMGGKPGAALKGMGAATQAAGTLAGTAAKTAGAAMQGQMSAAGQQAKGGGAKLLSDAKAYLKARNEGNENPEGQ
jgi:type IV secretion system protein TrbL